MGFISRDHTHVNRTRNTHPGRCRFGARPSRGSARSGSGRSWTPPPSPRRFPRFETKRRSPNERTSLPGARRGRSRSRRPPPCCRVVVGPIPQDRLLVGVCSAVRRPRPCRPAHPAPLVLQGFAMSRCRTSAGCGTGRRPVVGPSRSAAATGKASKSEAVGRPAACERRRVRRSRALPPQAAAGAPPRTTLLQPLYQR